MGVYNEQDRLRDMQDEDDPHNKALVKVVENEDKEV